MKMKWSASQSDAITSSGCNILVSAGAGSGKTAVLTERIFQLVKAKTPLSKFLILTFTKLAALEMKNRIRNKLLNDPDFKDSAPEIENAHIETFDSFNQFLVKKYSYRLGLSKDISVIDNSILTIEKNKILDDILEQYAKKKDSRIIAMIEQYCLKDIKEIKAMIFQFETFISKQIDKESFLKYISTRPFEDSFIEEYYNYMYEEQIENIKKAQDIMKDALDVAFVEKVDEIINIYLSCKDYSSLKEARLKNKAPNNSSKCTVTKDLYSKARPLIVGKDYGDIEENKQYIRSCKPYFDFVVEAGELLQNRINDFKKEKNTFSFDDISLLTLKLLKMKDIQDEMKESFAYILVDEYQDTSDIQEEVLKLLGKNNIYMVGDVKQSIYGFRDANCLNFQEKFDSYQENNGGKLIRLNDNFRSRKEIVDFINEFYGLLMNKENNIIEYNKGHHFNYGNHNYDGFQDNKESYRTKIFKYPYSTDSEASLKEIILILQDIIEKMNNKYQVTDKDGTVRDCTFSDFAILINQATDFVDYKKVFSTFHVPLKIVRKIDIKTNQILLVLLNLLKLFSFTEKNVFDEQYVHSYMSIARSFLIGLTDKELHDIVTKSSFTSSKIGLIISNLVKQYKDSSCQQIFEALLKDFDFYHAIIKLDNFIENSHIVETLLSKVKDMDSISYSLDDVINYFECINEFDLELEIDNSDVFDNTVSLMTIHASKGLEFPFVYIAGLYRSLYGKTDKSKLRISKEFGLLFTRPSPSIYQMIEDNTNRREKYEEAIRLLYVAMTRPKERLIILVGEKETKNSSNSTLGQSVFSYFLKKYPVYDKYGIYIDVDTEDLELFLDTPKGNIDNTPLTHFKFDRVSVEPHEITQKRASKSLEEDSNIDVLNFGTLLHSYFELVDFETKDLSFIENEKEKNIIKKVLSLKLFQDIKNDQVHHEFVFYDKENEISGIIDLLVIKEDRIDIIDFKLKNIDDEKYLEQLNVYKTYISKISNKPIHLYLVSIIEGTYKNVD